MPSLDELFTNAEARSNPFTRGFADGARQAAVRAAEAQAVNPPLSVKAKAFEPVTGTERIQAIKAARTASGLGLKEAKEAVDAAFAYLVAARNGDDPGTVRKDPYSDKYAFTVEPGKVLLIDTREGRGAYKLAAEAEIRSTASWTVITKE